MVVAICILPEGGDSDTPFHRQRYSVCVGYSVNAWKSTLCIIPGIGCSSSVEGKIPCTVIFVTDQCRSQKALHVDSGSSFLVKVWACTVVMGGQNAFDMIPIIDITKILTLLIPFQYGI